MEFRGVYVLWGFLPGWFIILSLWVFLRPLFKVSGKEKLDHYYPSLFYTLGCYILTLFIDQFGVVEAIVGWLVSMGVLGPDLQLEILRFLLYPAVLVAIANIQRIIRGEDSQKKRTLPKSQWGR